MDVGSLNSQDPTLILFTLLYELTSIILVVVKEDIRDQMNFSAKYCLAVYLLLGTNCTITFFCL